MFIISPEIFPWRELLKRICIAARWRKCSNKWRRRVPSFQPRVSSGDENFTRAQIALSQNGVPRPVPRISNECPVILQISWQFYAILRYRLFFGPRHIIYKEGKPKTLCLPAVLGPTFAMDDAASLVDLDDIARRATVQWGQCLIWWILSWCRDHFGRLRGFAHFIVNLEVDGCWITQILVQT